MKSTNIYKNINNKGITLISLVVTIIVLIILAGVSVNIIMGENGLMNRAKEQKITQAKAEILQELELAKGPVSIEGNGYTSLEKYLTHIEENGLNSHRVTNINRIDDKNAEIVVDDKFVYTAAQIGNNVIINEVGYVEDLYPEISSFIIKDKNTNSITVELTGRRAEEYEFYIKAPNGEYKKVTTEKIDKTQVNSFNTLTYTYEKLTSIAEDESYKLKVIAKRGSRQTEKEIDSNIEAIVPAEGNVTIVSSPTDWTNGKITTTVETELTQYTIQYQIDATSETLLDDTKWTNYTQEIVSEKNEVIYIRLWDGINAGEITTQEITKIDTDVPNDANIELSAIKVEPTNEVKAQVALSDSKSDVKITSSKWVWTDSEDEVGLDESSYNGGTFSENPQEIPLDTTNEGTYYLHVLTVDNAGNMIETISESVIVKLESIAVIYSVDTNVTYQEKVYKDATCLSPTTFTPAKDGWTFVGWREDNTASGEVLTSKVMGSESITLYAVFEKDLTITYVQNGATSSKKEPQYYNNGNITNAKFTIANPTRSGCTFKGWSTSASSTTVTYSSITNLSLSNNLSIYAVWTYNNKTVTGSAYSNSSLFYEGTQNRATIYSSVDTSKYYAATLKFTSISVAVSYRGVTLYAYVSDGTNKTQIGYTYNDWGDPHTRYPDLGLNYNPTLTFSKSSGTVPIYFQTVASSGTVGDTSISSSTITLLGRTVVY